VSTKPGAGQLARLFNLIRAEKKPPEAENEADKGDT
jgi:hypothetical protein